MKILLVEDDPVNLALCRTFLEKLGHEVFAATDAEAAWIHLLSSRAQIIISDWNLPGLSGIGLCEKVRARTSSEYAYFIVITAFQGTAKLNQAMDAGVDDFLTKPIDMDMLAIRLRVATRILEFHGKIGLLENMLPICMYCKKIRNDQAYWESVETYFTAHMGADFTHSLCPDCYSQHILPQLGDLRNQAEGGKGAGPPAAPEA